MMKIIESPREGMQGFTRMISTEDKIRYINRLLRAGFDVVETGSLVSPKLIPQMADSLEVLKKLDLSGITTGRMVLAVNKKGAEILSEMDEITHIAYPFSFSPAFMKLNMNSTPEQALETTGEIVNLCDKNGKQAVIYISMAFGNPYGNPWDMETLVYWADKLHQLGARTIPLSNVSVPLGEKQITEVYSALIPMFTDVEFGLHLHTTGDGWYKRVNAAYLAGCRRFDSVISGRGGCPMAGEEMLGNLKTEDLVEFAWKNRIHITIDQGVMKEVCTLAGKVFLNNEY
jgi:hydroxymethylglutaryl-CoA lyase